MSSTISHHSALIYTMVLVSAADRDMTDNEIATMGEIVRSLPIFRSYDFDLLATAAQTCAELLDAEEGLETVLALIREALPDKLCETAYAIACEIAAADGKVSQEELRLLEIIRHRFDVGRLVAAAIERGVRARYVTI